MLRSMIEDYESKKGETNKSTTCGGSHGHSQISPRSVNNYGSFTESDIIKKNFLLQKPVAKRGDALVKGRYCAFCRVLFYQEYSPGSTDKFCSKDCQACSIIASQHLEST